MFIFIRILIISGNTFSGNDGGPKAKYVKSMVPILNRLFFSVSAVVFLRVKTKRSKIGKTKS